MSGIVRMELAGMDSDDLARLRDALLDAEGAQSLLDAITDELMSRRMPGEPLWQFSAREAQHLAAGDDDA